VSEPPGVLSWRSILRAIVAMWWVYASVGVLVPLLPQYVTDRYGGGATAIGVTVLVYGVASVAGRPVAGLYLRTGEPWRLMTLSAVVGVVALVLTPLAPNLGAMLALRFVDGAAVGAFYTAAATSVVHQTPHGQRARVLSYFSVPLFLGVAIGPVVGDALIAGIGQDGTWLVSGAIMFAAAPGCVLQARRVARAGRRAEPVSPAPPAPREPLLRALLGPLVQPSAVWPAVVLALSIVGYAGFQALVPVYGPEIGLPATGTVFFLYSFLTLVIRIAGAAWFDRLPLVEVVLVGCLANVAGLVVAWLWAAPAALYVSAALMAVAIALQYVLLMKLALTGMPREREGSVVAAYSISYDVGAGLGAAALGLVVSATGSYRSAFLAGAVCAVLGALVLVGRFWRRRHRYAEAAPQPGSLRTSPLG
jgi:predicted MFS family arabinose efflux permease